MADNSTLANALLAHASIQPVVDMLFTHATPHAVNAHVSADVAMSQYKGDLYRVTALAACAQTDPDVLAKFTKDTRVSVRTALIGNSSVPQPSMLVLAHWAATRDSWLDLSTALSHLDPEDVVTVLETNASHIRGMRHVYQAAVGGEIIAGKVVGNRDLSLRVLATGIDPACGCVLLDVSRSLTPDLDAVEAYDAIPCGTRKAPAEHMLKHTTVLTLEVAAVAVAHASSARGSTPLDASSVGIVEPGSLEIIADGDEHLFAVAVTLGLGEAEIVPGLAGFDRARMGTVIDAVTTRAFTPAFEQALVKALVARTQQGVTLADDTSTLLARLRHPLPPALVMAWLRSQGYETTLAWIGDVRGLNRPQPGQLAALVAESGAAFSSKQVSMTRLPSGMVERTVALLPVPAPQRDRDLVEAASKMRRTPGYPLAILDEVRAITDATVGQSLTESMFAAEAMPVLEAALGDQMTAWETVFTLAGDWTGGLEGLIGAALSLSGCERLSADVPADSDAEHVTYVQDFLHI